MKYGAILPMLHAPCPMLLSYLHLSIRTLLRYRSYALLNLLGLTMGLVCGILIFLLIRFQVRFDRYHSRIDRIYQVTTVLTADGAQYDPGTHQPVGNALRNDYAFLEQVATVEGKKNVLITAPAGKFNEEQTVCFSEPSYFRIFDYGWRSGTPETALSQPNTVVMTRRMAEKFFGTADPRGQRLRLNNDLDLQVTGVLENIPDYTDRRHEVFISYATLANHRGYVSGGYDNWQGFSSRSNCFVLLREGTSPATLEAAMPAFSRKYHKTATIGHPLVPFREMHFSERYGRGIHQGQLWALGLVGLFLVLTAVINFVNLATAQALRRAKEVGVRKVVGGTRLQLFWQFITETAVLTGCSAVTAVLLTELILPFLQRWSSHLRLPFPLFGTENPLADGLFWVFLGGIATVVTFLAGSYPGLVLAGFRPVQALKGRISGREVGGMPVRRSLVFAQFILTQLLIISTLVVIRQMHYFRTASVGFDTSAIRVLNIPDPVNAPIERLRNQLARIPGVEQVSFCGYPPASTFNSNSGHRFNNRPEEESWSANMKPVDAAYLTTFGLKLVAGKPFPAADSIRGFLVNETYVRRLGLRPADVIGKNLEAWGKQAPIYGVVKDWSNLSSKSEAQPVVLFSEAKSYYSCCLKLSPQHLSGSIAAVDRLWNETFPDYLLLPYFVDEQLAVFLITEEIILACTEVFAIIAIIIGCLGLYGLVGFMATQKTKEIGVRKVLGASVGQILLLFGREFALLIGAAFAIAAPLAGWLMSEWLKGYAHRVPVGPGLYLLAIGTTVVITALTVGYQSVRAARANPVRSLKSE